MSAAAAAEAGQAIASAVAAGKPVAIHSEGMSATSWGVWTLVVLLIPIVFTGMFKFIPNMRTLADARSGKLDDERRSDMDDMRKEIVSMRDEMREMRREVDAAKNKAQVAENKLVSAVSAVSLLSAEVRRLNPDSPVLAQVAELLAAASSGDFGVGSGIERLSRLSL